MAKYIDISKLKGFANAHTCDRLFQYFDTNNTISSPKLVRLPKNNTNNWRIPII